MADQTEEREEEGVGSLCQGLSPRWPQKTGRPWSGGRGIAGLWGGKAERKDRLEPLSRDLSLGQS